MANHEQYYVPEQSKWPIVAAIALLTLCYGLGSWLNDLSAERSATGAKLIFIVGVLLVVVMFFGWFGSVIKESERGLYGPQMDRSFRWGMKWFIFSEVMFFAAFFGVLFYVRFWAGPWLGGLGDKGVSNMLWPGFEYQWPLLNNPDGKLYPAPKGVISAWGLPLINTLLLVTSSITLSIAHHALRKQQRKPLMLWLGLTVALGVVFLALQIMEYMHAYNELGLTLGSGIYGATFFMLTGFHGVHVTIGALILLVMLVRIMKGAFTPEHHFGFEAAAWYWHFVDVVWLLLFLFVYVL